MKMFSALLAFLLYSPALANAADSTKDTLYRTEKGLSAWLTQGYSIAGGTGDMIILTSGNGSVVLCRILQSVPTGITGLGSNSQQKPSKDSIDVSRCYAAQ